MCGTKVMNYLVKISILNRLKFISKFHIVTMYYFCVIRFYTFLGFHWYKISNFWTCRIFSMHFTSFSIFDTHLNLFEPELATWHNPIGGYQFGRIEIFGRRILWCFEGPDHPIPLWLSDLFLTLGSRSNDRGQNWESGSLCVRVPVVGDVLAHWWWSSAALRRLPEAMKVWTVCKASRESQMRDQWLASSREGEEQPKGLEASVTFGWRPSAQFATS
jgi:hypothetical protein